MVQSASKPSDESPSVEKIPDSKHSSMPHSSPPSAASQEPVPTQLPSATLSMPSFTPPSQTQGQAARPLIPSPQQFVEILRRMETRLELLKKSIADAIKSGNSQMADAYNQEYNKQLYAKNQLSQLALQQGVRPGNPGAPVQPMQSSPNHKDSQLDDIPLASDSPQASAQLLSHRNSGSPFLSAPNSSPSGSSTHAIQSPAHITPPMAQMPQPAEQRTRPMHSTGPGGFGQRRDPPHMEQGSGANAAGDQPKSRTIWLGTLTWTGFDAATQDRKEVHSQVAASHQSGGDGFVFYLLTLLDTSDRSGCCSSVDQRHGRRHCP
jgi:hypothetical protein